MKADTIAAISMLIVAFLFAWSIKQSIAGHLRATLDELVHLPAATAFYLRVFSLGLYFIAVGNGIFGGYDTKNPPSHFMEYVWPLAQTFLGMLVPMGFYLLFHLLLVTIVIVVLRRKNV
jgi:hypothetical protein